MTETANKANNACPASGVKSSIIIIIMIFSTCIIMVPHIGAEHEHVLSINCVRCRCGVVWCCWWCRWCRWYPLGERDDCSAGMISKSTGSRAAAAAAVVMVAVSVRRDRTRARRDDDVCVRLCGHNAYRTYYMLVSERAVYVCVCVSRHSPPDWHGSICHGMPARG